MKICPNCNNQVDYNSTFCPSCGMQFGVNQQTTGFNQTVQQPLYPQAYNPYDHTAEFDPKDISDNKVISMLVYLMGTVGIIIALLASHSSPYTAFHVRQALKFTVINILMLICAVLLLWTIIIPIAYAVMTVVLSVVKIICFFQICSGKAVEPVIIRSLKFLR